MRVPVAVLGGGAFAARLAEVIATSGLPALDLRLHARDAARLAVIAAHADGRLVAAGAPHRARAYPALDDALGGAAVVVLLVRVGGLAARAHDEAFPRQLGLVGDEGVGVGGMANAWRTVPALEAIAARIAARCPGARVLNLMAPLGVTTRLLGEAGLRAVGLCELPMVTAARWRAQAGVPREVPPLAYAGLNHLGFFWDPAGAAGRAAADGGPAGHRTQTAADAAGEHPLLRAAVAAGDVPEELLARLSAAPLHYFVDVFEPEAASRIGRQRRPGRAAELVALQADLVQAFRQRSGQPVADLDRRPTPWFDQALVPALHAALGGPAYRAALNLDNGAALAEAPAAAIVELWGRLDGSGARFDPVPARPAPVRAVLARLAAAEDHLYRACVRRDRGLLAEALEALPLAWDRTDAALRAALIDGVCRPLTAIHEVSP